MLNVVEEEVPTVVHVWVTRSMMETRSSACDAYIDASRWPTRTGRLSLSNQRVALGVCISLSRARREQLSMGSCRPSRTGRFGTTLSYPAEGPSPIFLHCDSPPPSEFEGAHNM
jgi:hypothetical protein